MRSVLTKLLRAKYGAAEKDMSDFVEQPAVDQLDECLTDATWCSFPLVCHRTRYDVMTSLSSTLACPGESSKLVKSSVLTRLWE